jgi:hypothetical protein
MATPSKDSQVRSAAAAVKAERALDKVAAMQEYEAEALALRANTERLRALRLAREAGSKQQPATPAEAAPGPIKVRKRAPAAKRVGGKPPKVA